MRKVTVEQVFASYDDDFLREVLYQVRDSVYGTLEVLAEREHLIVESHKYFPEPIGWFWHTIVFVDGSVFILSYNVAERGAIEYFTGLPYLPSEE